MCIPQFQFRVVADERADVVFCLIEIHLPESLPQEPAQLRDVQFAVPLPVTGLRHAGLQMAVVAGDLPPEIPDQVGRPVNAR